MRFHRCDRCGKECNPHSVAVAEIDDATYLRATIEVGTRSKSVIGSNSAELCIKCLDEISFWVKKWWEDR